MIRLGSVGTQSGPVGNALKGALEAVQVWQRVVNDNGGLNGHQVQIIFADDGGDPARHLAAKKELVERQRVIAFVQENGPLGSGRSSQKYLESAHIPVVGSDAGSQWFYQSPMYFPQTTSGLGSFYIFLASHARAVADGKRKLGTLTCTETTICDDGDRVYAENAASFGFQPVYRGKASLAQPDFTAECLAARNAGVQTLAVVLDPNSIGRLVASCTRQNYRPTYALGASMIIDEQTDIPDMAGALGATNVFPWFQAGTPATDAFHAAMDKYLGKKKALGIAHATGWVSAKLFEKAAADMPEPPTSEAVLRGLWTMKNETLGGITKVAFTEGGTAPLIVCWFDVVIRSARWESPDNFAQHCTNPPASLTK